MSNKGGRVSPDYLADIAPEYAAIELGIPTTVIQKITGHANEFSQDPRTDERYPRFLYTVTQSLSSVIQWMTFFVVGSSTIT